MRKGLVKIWLLILFAAIATLFWHNEFVYSLPTPVPANYKTVKAGELINLRGKIELDRRPLFLHFFNPDCPCSKFNISHFKSLVKLYRKEVTFKIVVMSADRTYTAKQIQDKFDLNIPVLFDSSIAVSCGVYSTPQAVILDTDGRLYYRGNYNKSRYCTDAKSNYAQMAIDSLLQQKYHPVFSSFAVTAYGCQLPKCSK